MPAVAYSSGNWNGTFSSTTTLSLSMTTASVDSVMLLCTGCYPYPPASVSSAVFDGAGMTALASLSYLDGVGVFWQTWYLYGHESVTDNVAITTSATAGVLLATGLSFANVDQSYLWSQYDVQHATSVSSLDSSTYTSNPSGSALVAFGGGDAVAINPGTNATRGAGTSSSNNPFGGYYLNIPSSAAIGVTTASGTDDITLISVRVPPTSGGGGGNPWYYYAQQRQVRQRRQWERRGQLWTPKDDQFNLRKAA